MRVAVIGAGIAGGAAAWALATGSGAEVVVYERDGRPGGHSLTVDVAAGSRSLPVDVGFLVYNEATYPDFTRLLAHLGVATRPADMSFCLADADGEHAWSSRGGLPLAADLGLAGAWRLMGDLRRFHRLAADDLAAGRLGEVSLGDWLAGHALSPRLRDDYLVPMASAIWTMPAAGVLAFPARTFLAFFENHRLLRLSRRPAWRTVSGGSRIYVERLAAPWRARMRGAAAKVRRHDTHVEVIGADGARDAFDALVLACHPDEALALLADPGPEERACLGAIGYRTSDVVLHRDVALMPRRREAWAAWTIRRDPEGARPPAVTYWLNALQGVDPATPLFVSLDPPRPPDPALVLGRFSLSHPQFDAPALRAQERLAALQGRWRTWYAGAWTGYGFHEDGLRSGLAAAEALGAAVPWRARAIAGAAE